MAKFSVKRPLTVFVGVILVMVLGVISFMKLTPDLMPDIDAPYVAVLTAYPGATPEKVEEEISKPMEQSLSTLQNIKNVQSISDANYSLLVLEFNNKVNMDTITVDILSDINMISYGWDDTVGSPTVIKMNPSMIPVSVAAVSYKDMDIEEISRFVDDTLINKLEGTEGVARVDTSGMLQSQINVVIDQNKIDKLNNKMLASVNSELAKAERQIRSGQTGINSAKAKLKKQASQLEKKKEGTYDKLADAKAKVDSAQTYAGSLVVQLETTKQELEAAKTMLAGDPEMADSVKQLEAQIAELEKQKTDAEKNVADLQKAYIQAEKGSFAAIDGFATAESKMAEAQATLNASASQLESAMAQFEQQRDEALKKADLGSALTAESISALLKAQNFSMPAGYVSADGDDKYLVSVGDEIKSLKEVKNLVLMDSGVDSIGEIRVNDIADVFKSDNSGEVYAKINGKNGVAMSFSKQSNYATAEVCDNLAGKFKELEEEYEGLSFNSLMDQGYYINLIIRTIMQTLLLGALFAIIVLALFLRNWKPTLIVMLAMPVSIVFAVTLMYFSGMTLNMISLSGIAIAVGMLVDNSIVVIENTTRLRQMGVPAVKAAIAGAKQVGGAITASTLTTICVFFPIVFTDGITREMFSDMALTVTYVLLASLVVAMSLVPAMSSSMLVNMKTTSGKEKGRIRNAYLTSIKWVLKHKAITICVALLLLTVSVVSVVIKGLTFIPEMSSPQMMVTITMPEGASVEKTMKVSDQVMEEVMKVDEVETVGAMFAENNTMSGESGSENVRQVNMYVTCNEDMKRTSAEIADDINKRCKGFDGEVKAAGGAMMMETYMEAMGGTGVTIDVFGEDKNKLIKAAKDIGAIVEDTDGVTEVDTGVQDTDPEIHFAVNRKKAAEYGLTVAQVYQEIQKAVTEETKSTEITWKDNNYDVVVKGTDPDRLTPEYIKNNSFTATLPDGDKKTVKFSDICDISETEALSTVTRYNQRTLLSVKAEIDDDHNITLMTDEILKKLDKEYKCPEGISYESNGLSDTIYDAMKDLVMMLIVAVILIYLIMVAQFQSLLSPFIIMFTIPLAFTGGLLALLITGQEISVIAMIGFIMLAGIIVNNGIVLIDYTNRLRAAGRSKKAAIAEAGMTRMRPVLMTCLTTVMGLSVMAVTNTAGTDMMKPLAIVCIGGLLYATLLTLYVVPALYDLFNKEEYKHRTEKDLDISGVLEEE